MTTLQQELSRLNAIAKTNPNLIKTKEKRSLISALEIAVEALDTARNVTVEGECDECGVFTCVRYEIKPIIAVLDKITKLICGDKPVGGGE